MVGSRKEGLKILWHMHTYPPKGIKRYAGLNQPHHSAFKNRHYTSMYALKKAAQHLDLPKAQTCARWLANKAQGQGHDRGFLWFTREHQKGKKQEYPHLPSWLQIFIPLSPQGLKWKWEVWGGAQDNKPPVTRKMQQNWCTAKEPCACG